MITTDLGPVGWYGAAVGTVLAVKLLMSIRRRKPRTWRAPGHMTVAAIVTVYNEDETTLVHALSSLAAQTRRPDVIHVVDDGSTTGDYARIRAWFLTEARRHGLAATWTRTANQGKRRALAEGFCRSWTADIFCCIDSDTVLAPDAVAQALGPFSSRRVHAVTGLVLARNRARNLLTRLIDMRYVNAFLGERVAYSRLGSVLCVCGSLALYRGWVVRKHLNDFLTQQFLGAPATFGDDRRLTYYALTEGKAVIQPTAVGHTDVPESLGHYLRQQIRWTKSFIREALLMIGTGRAHRAYWWLNLLEAVTWCAFTAALIVGITAAVFHPAGLAVLGSYLLWVCAVSWLRSLHYLRSTGRVPRLDRAATFAAAPLYALMNLTLLVPLRFWAIATLRNGSWGTRASVEVAAAPAALPAPPKPRAEVGA
ncbi:glycosyltransferase [Actinomadura sp. LOL_016]|uniref:glycosyltransferase family 2 protein n=1 Tax=unclassified Actinomadura TaxID=2626254 RepID=UPI003A807185